MSGPRLAGKVAIVMGAGQTPGNTVGNGRAAAQLFAREGARVVAVDREIDAAQDTVAEIVREGGEAFAVKADVTEEPDVAHAIAACVERWDRIDVLHNNVGISIAGGDAPIEDIDAAAFDRITSVNLKGMVLACKHALGVMRRQGGGAIVNISSLAAVINYPYVTYRTSKAGVVTLTEHIAVTQAQYGIRANVILPGLIETPMAIENRVGRNGRTREDVIAERNSHVPLRNRMGTGWDVAKAALFLASDDAEFVTGAVLAVDGGQRLVAG